MRTTSDGVVVIEIRIDPDHWVTEDFDSSGGPHYTVGEFAKFFFDRTAAWIRWREQRGFFILDATKDDEHEMWVPTDKSEIFGLNRTEVGARYYTLRDVEGIAHALAQKGAINGAQLNLAIATVKVQAQTFGHL